MPIYLVREYHMGVATPDWQEVRATSEAHAAEIICGAKLRTEGMRQELRAHVRRMGDASQDRPITLAFYGDPQPE